MLENAQKRKHGKLQTGLLGLKVNPRRTLRQVRDLEGLAVSVEKKAQLRARKAENAALLEAEDSDIKPKKTAAKGPKLDPDNPLMLAAKKKAANGPLRGADKVAAKKAEKVEQRGKEIDKFGSARSSAATEEFAASNIDDALDLMNLATTSSSTAQASNAIERHPERRAKAAYVNLSCCL